MHKKAKRNSNEKNRPPIMRFLQIEEKLNAHLERKRKAAFSL